MKKILYIFCVFLITSTLTSSVFADDCSNSCSIKDAPAPVLQEYVDTNRKIIAKISNQLVAQNTNNFLKQQWVKIYNSAFNWSTFKSWIDFLSLQLSDDVPVPVKRDQDLLKSEWEYLAKFLQNMIVQNSSQSVVENVCDWISNCNLSWSAGQIVGQLIKNHSNVLEFYKLSLLGKETSFKWSFILVNQNFKSELHNHYNTYTLTDCSQCELWFKNIITKAIKEISTLDQKWKDWIQEWQDAWATLNWSKNDTAEYAQRERELLQEELSRQWLDSNNWDIILNNLDKYNNNSYWNVNNRINNSFTNFNSNVENNTAAVSFTSNIFKSVKQLYQKWADYLNTDWDSATVSISELVEIDSNITSASLIMQEIDSNYEKQVPFLSAQDTTSEKLFNRLITMHVDLSEAINILDKTIKISEKVCNDQDQWNWKCSY